MPRTAGAKSRRDPAPVGETLRRLAATYPQARCSLEHGTPLELLVATILSAQCTDARVNMVTPELFRKFPGARALADAPPGALEDAIKSTGFFNAKARSIRGAARALVERHGGEVPRTMEELLKLPGVGRKTANVVLGNAFGNAAGVVVDTHVGRISRRLGWTRHTDPEKVELDLNRIVPRESWVFLPHALIYHGRSICTARNPLCESCRLFDLCPKIGVTPRSAATPRNRKSTSTRPVGPARVKRATPRRATPRHAARRPSR
jgi:endonuclease-3